MAQIDADEEIKAVNHQVWKLSNEIIRLNNDRYKRFIYNLVNKGVAIETISATSGYTRRTIYNIIDEFDKGLTEQDGSTEI